LFTVKIAAQGTLVSFSMTTLQQKVTPDINPPFSILIKQLSDKPVRSQPFT